MKLTDIKQAFEGLQNQDRALSMKAYMKGQFDFYGVNSPDRKSIQKESFSLILKMENDEIWDLILDLWKESNRELQLYAIDLLNRIPKKRYAQTDMAKVEVLLTSKSWWDTVDAIASNFVGKWFQVFPHEQSKWIEKWRNSDDFWLHRTCLIFQLKYRESTDTALLEDLIEQFKTNKEFFIQKAIGWSLRQHSRFSAQWVQDTVEKQKLEGLAKREALRLINN